MYDETKHGGILNALLKIDVRQCLDAKHNYSKLTDTVNIDVRNSF